VAYVAGLLDEIGLGGERVTMVNLSSAMGAQFAEMAREMTEKIRRSGPNPLGNTSGRADADADRRRSDAVGGEN
jgi:coenzyme F420-reducing hydrogenase delta subunit